MTKIGETADLVVGGKIITRHLLQDPSPFLPPSSAQPLWSPLVPCSHLPLGRPEQVGVWQWEIFLIPSSHPFRRLCETVIWG